MPPGLDWGYTRFWVRTSENSAQANFGELRKGEVRGNPISGSSVDEVLIETVWKLRTVSNSWSREPAQRANGHPFRRFALPTNARSDPSSDFSDSFSRETVWKDPIGLDLEYSE